MHYRVGIVGCGLIGQKRAKALGCGGTLVACADTDIQRAHMLAQPVGAQVFENWQSLLSVKDVDMVIIATPHDLLSEIALESIKAGKHVLVEKPVGRVPTDVLPLIEAARDYDVKVRVGFNHRYHRVFRKARELFDAGLLGELMFIRARYGHGGRVGYEKEWRAQPNRSGGGELIDQGAHLIDLSRWFLGEFEEIQGFAHTYYWPMPVDDNCFMMLKTSKQQMAFLHASCTEWKNLFSMEIYGRDAKLEISGLGGSYGIERLAFYQMLPQMGPPETTIWEYPMEDNSWAVEMEEFFDDIRLNRQPSAGLSDAYQVLNIVQRLYHESGYRFD